MPTPHAGDPALPCLVLTTEPRFSTVGGRFVFHVGADGSFSDTYMPEWAIDSDSEIVNLSFSSDLGSLAILRTLRGDQALAVTDTKAAALLGWIADSVKVKSEHLAEVIESPSEWIAFSRLQRARLIDDLGTWFILSGEGRRLIALLTGEKPEDAAR